MINPLLLGTELPAYADIRPDVANNPTVFLAPAEMARMVPPDSLNNDMRRLMTRTFTSFKTGL